MLSTKFGGLPCKEYESIRSGARTYLENSTMCTINANRLVLRCFHSNGRAMHDKPQFLCVFSFEIITKQKQLVKQKIAIASFVFCQIKQFYGEFDPGSGRTLAACLTHASRTMKFLRGWISGERVRNT